MKFSVQDARKLLDAADVFFEPDDEEIVLNMNDVWGWATAYGEYVKDEELPELAGLFWNYGWAGILYWVSEKNNNMESEFYDVNRCVQFVRHEERLRKSVPNSSKRAYKKLSYTIGQDGWFRTILHRIM